MPTYTLTIASAPKSFRTESIRISETINGRNTLECEIVSTDGSYRPAMGAEVILTEDGVRIFGGNIDQPAESGLRYQGGTGIVTRIRAVDFKAIPDRRTITGTIASGNLKAALTHLVNNYFDDHGITLHASQVNGPTLPELKYDTRLGSDVLTELGVLTNYIWEIDYNKVLRMYAPGDLTSPFNIIPASDDNAIWDISVEPTEVDYANRIIVLAGDGAREVTEAFTGNGSATEFELGYQLIGHRGYVTHAGANETLGTSGATWIVDTSALPHTITRTAAPANGAAISITYTAQFPFTAQSDDVTEQGSRGIHEQIIKLPEIFDKSVAEALADNYLDRATTTFKFITYQTLQTGLFVGRTQTVTVSQRNLSGTFLVTDISTEQLSTANRLVRRVRAVSGTQIPGSWRDTYKEWSGGTTIASSTINFDASILPVLSGEYPGDVVANTGEVAGIETGGELAGEVAMRGVVANATYFGPGVTLGLPSTNRAWQIAADFSRASPLSRGLFFTAQAESSSNRYAMALRQDATGVTGEYYLVPNSVTSLFLGAPSSWGFGSGFRITKGWLTDLDVTNGITAYGRTIKEGEWTTYTPTWTAASSNPTLGNGAIAGWVMRHGDTVFFEIRLSIGSSTTLGTGAWRFTVPVTAHTDYAGSSRFPKSFPAKSLDASASSAQADGAGEFVTATTIQVSFYGTSLADATTPISWATDDRLFIEGWYEAA